MRIITFLLALTILSTWALGQGQDYTFKVLLNKGENTFKTPAGPTVQVKSGLQIGPDGEIVMTNEAFLGLLHSTGKILQLRGEGKYTIEQLQKQVIEAKRNSRFNQYIPARMSENERNRMNKGTRAVEVASSIAVMLPEMADLYGDNVLLKWVDANPTDNPAYKISVMNLFGDVIYEDQTGESTYLLDFTKVEDDVALYTVIVKNVVTNNESAEYKIKKVSSEEMPQIMEDLEIMSQEINTNSPLELLILTTFYQKNNLPLDAMAQYEEVLAKYPDYNELREYYNDFLESYGILKK